MRTRGKPAPSGERQRRTNYPAAGSVLWQRGLADLCLRADRTAGDERASDSPRARKQRRPVNQGRRDVVAAKRPKKDVAIGKTGGSSKPKPKKKTSRGK